ncbi:hypothetical protein BCR44DRAFT_38743 [Catenaria anguillulae PL171]|uniref:Uncharacterized protein n=1 Tax=Catenaria anguillulae PL171 TaxID=765915 RepID=A0A1Y2HHT5_9FUNG|nr:hypothetical protein BCR44DRAFT_38743 [Catenaria anguillulae PL171]
MIVMIGSTLTVTSDGSVLLPWSSSELPDLTCCRTASTGSKIHSRYNGCVMVADMTSGLENMARLLEWAFLYGMRQKSGGAGVSLVPFGPVAWGVPIYKTEPW